MRILGLIPARGGSKAIQGKNIKPLAGKSLVQRAFECSILSGLVERTILSTDDPTIAELARGFGMEVPFLRPAELASDESPMIDVAIHALTALKETDYVPDALLILQPTSPLRRPEHIREAVRLLEENDSVCSVTPIPQDSCPHYLMKIGAHGLLDFFMPDGARYTRRQDVPPAYKRDGTIFLTRIKVALDQRSLYGSRCVPMMIAPEQSLSINDPVEWAEAERRLGGVLG